VERTTEKPDLVKECSGRRDDVETVNGVSHRGFSGNREPPVSFLAPGLPGGARQGRAGFELAAGERLFTNAAYSSLSFG
jgi:hypothetical protein